MQPEVCRLTAADNREMLDLLHTVFTRAHKREENFEKMLPRMSHPTDEVMGKHLAIRADGKIAALLGIYPLPVRVAGHDLMFSTVGNVATHPDYEGRGYMSILLDAAMKELDAIGADASRLGGKRSRYGRYGYELAGSMYHFDFSADRAPVAQPVEFARIARDDTDYIEQATALHDNDLFAMRRGSAEGFYETLIAWENLPMAALDSDGKFVGYCSVSPNGRDIAEIYAVSAEALCRMVYTWARREGSARVNVMPHQIEYIRALSKTCDGISTSSPSQFLIRSWDKVTQALMDLKASYTKIPDGKLVVEIQGWGILKLTCADNHPVCTRADETPDISLNRLDATRYLFGTLPSVCAAYDHPFLPLPLTWNLQDRV